MFGLDEVTIHIGTECLIVWDRKERLLCFWCVRCLSIPVQSHLYLRATILAFKSMTGQVPEGTLAVGRPDHLPSLIYRFLKPSRDRDLFITEF